VLEYHNVNWKIFLDIQQYYIYILTPQYNLFNSLVAYKNAKIDFLSQYKSTDF
jgi:hypothetical protein